MTLDEAIAQLRELNEEVPKPLRLPQTAEVSAAEKRLGVKFHPDYRKFLLEAGDVTFGTLEPATLTVRRSPNDLLAVCESAWDEMDLPRELLPFCEDNGDYYCMNEAGEVVFWSHNDGEETEKWPSLAAWIEEVWIGENE